MGNRIAFANPAAQMDMAKGAEKGEDYVFLSSPPFEGEGVVKVELTKGIFAGGGKGYRAIAEFEVLQHQPEGNIPSREGTKACMVMDTMKQPVLNRAMGLVAAIQQCTLTATKKANKSALPDYFSVEETDEGYSPVILDFTADDLTVGYKTSRSKNGQHVNVDFFAVDQKTLQPIPKLDLKKEYTAQA